MNVVKISVSIPKELNDKINEFMKKFSVENKSKVITDAVNEYLSRNIWSIGEGHVVGSIILVYKHEEGTIVQRILGVQHKYIDVIRSTTHVHLTKDLCFENISVAGDVKRVRSLYFELQNIRGVYKLDCTILPL